MLRTLIVLGPLVLAAMLAHPIMVSAQRVDMLQARPRELSRLPPRPPLTHTLERRRHPNKEQVAESQSAREARIAVAQREREAGLIGTLNEDLAALSRPREPPLSFEQWCETSDRVIETLEQLVTGGRTAERTRLLNLRVTFLENYLEFLIRGNELGHHITEQDIKGAVDRAQAVHGMDGTQSAQWEHVVQVIGGLRTGSSSENKQRTFKLLTRAVGLINYGIAVAVFEGPQADFSFQQWDHHSKKAIDALEKLVELGRGDTSNLLVLRKTFLEQYLSILMRGAVLGYDVTRQGHIEGATSRAQTLHDTDTGREQHWQRVLLLIRGLKADGQLQTKLSQLLELVKQ